MSIKLSILVCSLVSRHKKLNKLMEALTPQLNEYVEVLVEKDNGELSIGAKRNVLLDLAKGEYIAFVDDDDLVSADYVRKILKAIEDGPDCVGMEGVITTDGVNPKKFIHSIKYKEWSTSKGVYYRNPNHLNPVKREIAIKVRFPDINFGEDKDYSKRLLPLLKSEKFIKGKIYRYLYVTTKKVRE